jgi:integrase
MSRPPATIPALRRHRTKNSAYVRINGKQRTLGKWGDPKTEERYRKLIAHLVHESPAVVVDSSSSPRSVAALSECYLRYADRTFRTNGSPSVHLQKITYVLLTLIEAYGDLPLHEFGPRKLAALRLQWEEAELGLSTIKKYIGIILRMFSWAVGQEFAAAEQLVALRAIPPLRVGHTKAKAPKQRSAVNRSALRKSRRRMNTVVRVLVDVQLLTGCRPGELLRLKWGDIARHLGEWRHAPEEHKTRWAGKTRAIYFGPSASAMLKFVLPPDETFDTVPDDLYVFSPKMAELVRTTKRRGNGRVGETYTQSTYYEAVQWACRQAQVPSWTPYQLRHSAGERITRRYGINGAQAVLGHSSSAMTKRYVSPSQRIEEKTAAKIMSEIG